MSSNELWNKCQSIYQRSKHPKETETLRERHDGELIAPFYNNDKQLIAFISFTPMGEGFCFLNCCYVLPEYQGKGIATNLLKQLLDRCPNVFAATGNVVAFELYKKLGLYVRYRPYLSVSTESDKEMNNV